MNPLKMHSFHEGDVVKLKSGGPALTVILIQGDGLVTCKWFDTNLSVKEGLFQAISIELFDEKE
jgi:uncharacterized protein YodC (DUF2158 family)